MKIFLILSLIASVGFCQIKTQEMDGVTFQDSEQNPIIIEKQTINNNERQMSNREISNIILKNENSYQNPSREYGSFSDGSQQYGLVFDVDGMRPCVDGPEPATNSLFMLGIFFVLYFRRKFILNN